ncbi:MAG: glycosyltransferase [Pirellula sp.]|jgi:glycosyltransferase involved in cell wall biosynthesis
MKSLSPRRIEQLMGFLVPTYSRMPQLPSVNSIPGRIDFCYDAQPRDIMPSKQKPIGVLHIINGEHFSGAERVQQLLGKRLPDECVDPYFACLKQGKFRQNCGLEEERVFIEPMRSRLDWQCISRITSLAHELQVEVLHAHTPRSAMVANVVAGKLDLPWVFHVHSPTARDSTRMLLNRVNDLVERASLLSCNHIITVSKSLRREMLRRGYDRSRLTCVPNGVPSQEPIDPFSRINQEHWRLGMVALVRPRKGIEVLLDALARTLTSHPNISLDVIGPFETPEYEQSVNKLVDSLGVRDNVRFLGFTNNVPEAMRNLDAMVLPSLFGEGMPMVVLEALALGVPVIATKVEGTPEIVRDGIEGLLAKPGCAASISAKIAQMVQSRSEWSRMSTRAYDRHQEKFSDEQMAKRIAAVYRKLIDPVS